MPNIEIHQANSGELAGLLALLEECIEGMRCKGIDQWDDVYPGHATVARDVNEATVRELACGCITEGV